MANTVEVIIIGKDQLTPVLNKATGGMAGLSKVAKGALTLGLGAATAAAGALAAGLKFSIDEAMEAQEVQAQLGAVLESTGGVAGVTAEMANELATSLSGVTRFSDETILSGENLLLTFTNIGKDVFPAALEASLNLSTALGQDLNSSAIMLGKALNDPIKGVTALGRAGVQFSVDQKAMIESLVETGDLAAAQAIILKELETQMGGSAVAAGATFAGQLDILQNSLANVAEEIGTSLLPELTTLATDAGPVVVELFESLGEDIIPMIVDAVSDLGGGLIDLLADFNELRQGVEDAGEAAVDTNMSYEEYLETVGRGGGVAKFATSRWSNFLNVIGGGAVILNTTRNAIGLLSEEEFNQIKIFEDAETAIDGWTASLEDGTLALDNLTGGYEQNILAVITAREEIRAAAADNALLEASLVSAAEETEIMTEIFGGLEAAANDAAGEVAELESTFRDLNDTKTNVLSFIEDTLDALKGYASPEMLLAKQVVEDIVAAWEDPNSGMTWTVAVSYIEGVSEALAEGTPIAETAGAVWTGLAAPSGPVVALGAALDNARGTARELEDALIAASGNWEATFNLTVTGDPIPSLPVGSGNKPGGAVPKALGGPVWSGQEYLVGEEGPELFVPRTSGTIVPNRQLANAAAGARTGSNIFYGLTINAKQGVGSALAELARMRPKV